MAWRIRSWNRATQTGEVVSPHFGPWPFASASGVQFAIGEAVLVELAGPPSAYRVANVRPTRQRQPEGTRAQVFEQLNARRFDSCLVHAQNEHSITFWLGNCCPACGASVLVTFADVSAATSVDEDTDLSWPLFRTASIEEQRALALVTAPGEQTYCIVTNHGDGPDGPHVFIVARSITIAAYAGER
jgi:hypothetical protein